MLLSPKAGGVGLTLTAANHIVHLSRWWNPAVEDQCTDRALRIGQQAKEIHVYYPQAIHPDYGEHSFDLKLHSLLEKKRSLSRSVLASPLAEEGELRELLGATVG
jgi:SNF2 family DNA or RNA helicase